jgi:hypothetical protein
LKTILIHSGGPAVSVEDDSFTLDER